VIFIDLSYNLRWLQVKHGADSADGWIANHLAAPHSRESLMSDASLDAELHLTHPALYNGRNQPRCVDLDHTVTAHAQHAHHDRPSMSEVSVMVAPQFQQNGTFVAGSTSTAVCSKTPFNF
jgi:hypothetical protein